MLLYCNVQVKIVRPKGGITEVAVTEVVMQKSVDVGFPYIVLVCQIYLTT